MNPGWTCQRPSALNSNSGWHTSKPRPDVNRKSPVLQTGRPTRNDHEAMRAPGWTRTSGPQVRNLALFPLSYEGMTCRRKDSNLQGYCFTGSASRHMSACMG